MAQKNRESRPDNRAMSLNTGVRIIREGFFEEVTFKLQPSFFLYVSN